MRMKPIVKQEVKPTKLLNLEKSVTFFPPYPVNFYKACLV